MVADENASLLQSHALQL